MRIKADGVRANGGRGFLLPFSALAGIAGSLLLAKLAARKLTKPAVVETQFLSPWELGVPYEDVLFGTSDGLTLSGWWLPNADATRTVVVLGGYNSARQHVLGVSAALWRGGANVLLFDNRGRGSSEGDYVSLGFHEQLDAKAALGYAKRRAPGLPVGFLGYSMGGAVALIVAAEDRRIEAVVVDSPFASQPDLLRDRLRDYVGPLAGPAFALARRFLNHDPDKVKPVEAITAIAPRPVLFIHGTGDAVTDPDDSKRMYALAGEPKELWLVPGAEHVGSYYGDRQGYCGRVNAFFDRYLG